MGRLRHPIIDGSRRPAQVVPVERPAFLRVRTSQRWAAPSAPAVSNVSLEGCHANAETGPRPCASEEWQAPLRASHKRQRRQSSLPHKRPPSGPSTWVKAPPTTGRAGRSGTRLSFDGVPDNHIARAARAHEDASVVKPGAPYNDRSWPLRSSGVVAISGASRGRTKRCGRRLIRRAVSCHASRGRSRSGRGGWWS